MNQAKTVMFYFPDSNHPNNLRIVQDPTSQIRGIYFTKSQIKKVEELPFTNHHAVYFLFSEDDASLYIGKSINGIVRLKDHLREKDFWQFAVLFVTDNNSFDTLSIDYLEQHFIHVFSKTQYSLENRDLRVVKPNVNMFTEAALLSFANHIAFLLEALGISTSNQPTVVGEKMDQEDIFHAKKPFEATIHLTDGRFILQAGSIIQAPAETTLDWSDNGAFYRRYRHKFDQLIEADKAVLITQSTAKLLENIEFNKPSMPAELCSGNSQNGWLFWEGLDDKRRAQK
ncbi:GIY-YIG nuclease family protein [Sporosarcina sp. Te-1]|uniref:GIY-YIG nuclease family protein n=1 Tax=Sporosarcina sp. Te-1 TaxID=2818390 RepID=UPI001A9DB198|nr:GIY-YIG nuclease family protein [Sporosarcina sp. Te-1]QTD39434.1 GIY-YIG nuclease family protein [Sporosarcina sp. Te-1]